MTAPTRPTTDTNALDGLDPAEIVDDWTRRGLDTLGDGELFTAACELIAVPHEEPADSFTLHAPLEMMARAELLASVSPSVRDATRQRIAHIACTWATSGTPVEDPGPLTIEHPLDSLVAGLRDGDPVAADRAFVALCAERDQDQIIGDLADVLLPHLGGAAHGAIFLELLPRFRPDGINPARMARTLIRDLAAHPHWRLTWFDRPRPVPMRHVSLVERLISPSAEHEPTNHFVYPTMSLVDETGLAHDVLGDATIGITVEAARRDLLRVAAMSMLQDEPSNAPYGWTHCLTLPQAALSLAERATDPQLAIDVAATYVLGYRATQSSTPIDLTWEPDRPADGQLDQIVRHEPATAAAMAWHADGTQRAGIVRQLVDHAAPHHDAHLAKYTLACLDAAVSDPDAAHLYLAGAAYLAAWWHQHDTSTA